VTSGNLVLVATADLVSHVRGRAFGADQLADRLEHGIGWVPADLALTAFGALAETNAFGPLGDVRLRPDPSANLVLTSHDGGPDIELMLADTVNLDLSPWVCCPRDVLRRSLKALKEEFNLTLIATFEHEFTMLNADSTAMASGGPPFSAAALRHFEPFGTRLYSALGGAGFEPDTWLAEFGANQFEITLAPSEALVAADRAILLRELVRDLAKGLGWRASFSPLVRAGGIGNGVHVHFSLRDADATPILYDASQPGHISAIGGSFAAGILAHSSAICALTAPSVISYLRLRPHTWSAGHAFLGVQNREALLRICPTVGSVNVDQQYNLEFRAVDATANPWLVLAALTISGLDGLRRNLSGPTVIEGDPSAWTSDEREAAGVTDLPTSLNESLDALTKDEMIGEWLGSELLGTYFAVKEHELAILKGASAETICEMYASVY
jgi:glutamine synthetase